MMRAILSFLVTLALAAGEDLSTRIQAEAVAFAEARAAGQPGAFAFRIVKPPVLPPLRSGAVTIEPSHLSKQDPSGRCFVALRLFVDGQLAGMARVDIDGSWKGELLRARSSLARKQALTEDLFERVPFEGQIPAGALTELPEGQRLRQPVQAGKWLTRTDLEAIPLVIAGERVRLRASFDVLVLSTEATARSSGARGDSVRLELPTHKIVTGKVTGSAEVSLDFAK